jgi:hypothetical protein
MVKTIAIIVCLFFRNNQHYYEIRTDIDNKVHLYSNITLKTKGLDCTVLENLSSPTDSSGIYVAQFFVFCEVFFLGPCTADH